MADAIVEPSTVADRRGGRRRRAALVLAVVTVALLAAGCSSGDGGDEAGSDDTTSATSAEPVDFSRRGPYEVGTTVLQLDEREVFLFYPADPEALDDAEPVTGYSSAIAFPPEVLPAIPEQLIQDLPLDAYRDPAPSPDGPFPTIVYSHGAGDHAAFSSAHFEHMASWGFVTASPEHTERDLAATTLGSTVRTDDVVVLRGTLALLREQNAAGPLAGSLDLDELAAEGLSAGGSAALRFADDPEVDAVVGRAPTPGVRIEVPEDLAEDDEARRAYYDQAVAEAYARTPAPDVPSLLLAGEVDEAVPLASVERTFEWLAPPKRLAVIANAGHNSFTDACAPISAQGGLLQFAGQIPVPEELLALGDDGCRPGNIDPQVAYDVINHLTVAQLREVFGVDAEVAAASLEEGWLDELFPGALARYTHEP